MNVIDIKKKQSQTKNKKAKKPSPKYLYGSPVPPMPSKVEKPSVEITDKSTLDDLFHKYETTEPALVMDIYEMCGQHIVSADQTLSDMLAESMAQSQQPSDDEYEHYVKHNTLSKNISHGNSTQEDESSSEKVVPKIPPKPIQEVSWQNLDRERNLFWSEDCDHRFLQPPNEMTPSEIEMIVSSVREGGRGVDLAEENYLKEQYANDLFLINNYITEANQMPMVEKQKKRKKFTEEIQLKNEDFPSIVGNTKTGSSAAPAAFTIEELRQRRRT